MARTTEAEIRKIIESSTTITDFDPFISYANQLTTECCGDVAAYDETRLASIETLLAAHFYCLRDMRSKSETADDVQQSFDTKLDLYFSHTHHGQMALMMDTAGGLSALQKAAEKGLRTSVGLTWLGVENPDAISES